MIEPAGVRAIRWLAAVLAPGFVIAVAMAALELWPRNWGYSVGGFTVSRAVWLQTAAPIFLLAAGWLAALSVGLWRRRRWARLMAPGLFLSVMSGSLLSGLTGQLPLAVVVRALLETGVMTALSIWYLFWKPNVVRYFSG